jgi:hypothetical protein
VRAEAGILADRLLLDARQAAIDQQGVADQQDGDAAGLRRDVALPRLQKSSTIAL